MARVGSITLSLLLYAFTVTAQEQQADSIGAVSMDQRFLDMQKSAQRLSETNFNKGFISSPEQLFTGRFAGLQVSAQNGQPGAPSDIRLHNINSAIGNDQPLILLDGMPLYNPSASPYTDNLSFINPSDIASVTFVKNDATLAVYGSAAANGILFISTRKGQLSDKLRVQYSTTAAVSTLRKKADVLSSSDFRAVIEQELPDKSHLLGNYNTDWQDVIYRNAFSHDQHLTVSGAIHKTIPFRISAGHQNQQGILKTTNSKRNTIGVAINPSFLDNRLRLHLNVAGATQDARLAAPDVVADALRFDPTQPVYQNNKYGNYFAYLDENGDAMNYVPVNPLSMLEQQHIKNENNTIAGQIQANYRFDAVPGLNLNLKYSYQNSDNDYHEGLSPNMAAIAAFQGNLLLEQASHKRTNNFKEALVSYQYPERVFGTDISVMAGYSDAGFKDVKSSEVWSYNGYSRQNLKYTTENQFRNIFGKLSLLHNARYGVDISLSSEKAANLPEDNNVLNIAAGAHWDILKESFMAGQAPFSELKLYSSYMAFERHTFGSAGTFQSTIVAPQLKPEALVKIAIGSSFGLYGNKLQGDIAFVKTKTKDMWLILPVNFQGNTFNYLNNVATVASSGLEASLHYTLARSENFGWQIGTNLSYNKTSITELNKGTTVIYNGYFISRAGQPVRTFGLLEHEYDSQGYPIGNTYKRNAQGEFARVEKNTPDPTMLLSLSSEVKYEKFSLSFLLRGSTGNYIYNASDQLRGYLFSVSDTYLTNISGSYNDSRFTSPQGNSRFYLEDASFVRMEYLQLGYNAGALWKDRANLSLTATVQNAFVISKYSGQDPEVNNGIDNSQYPIPTTYCLGLKLDI